MGYVARSVDTKYTKSGIPVAHFRLAVDREFKDKDTGERATDWINCTAWRSTAELAAKYLGKGRLVVVQGRLQIQEYQDSQGNRRTGAEIVVNSIHFCDKKPQAQQEQPAYAPAAAYAPVAAGAYHSGGYGGDDLAAGGDLPF